MRLFGPILFYDLVTTARRTRFFIIRYLCLLMLVGLLFFVNLIVGMEWGWRQRLRACRCSTDHPDVFCGLVLAQSIFLVARALADVCGCIAEEK